MTDFNKLFMSGRLVKDIDSRDVGNSTVISGTVASNRSVKKGEQWEEVATFIDFKLWSKSPKQVEFYKGSLKKGAKVTLEGMLIQETWEKDGQKHSKLLIQTDKVDVSGNNGSSQSKGDNVPQYDASSGVPEDIPF